MQRTIKILAITWLLCTAPILFAQESETIMLSQDDLNAIQKSEEALAVWFEALKTPGVRIEEGKMFFSEEAQKLIEDPKYRMSNFPEKGYTFADVQHSLGHYDFQKAFYQMLTMYPDHKEEVVRFIYSYDKVFPTDEVLVASFYTYAFFDPKITKITDGKPEILRPDLFEEYLRRSREIVGYIQHFRAEATGG